MTVIILSITTSMEIVGFYTFARRLVELPRSAIQSAIITYAVPVFSKRVKEDGNVGKFYHELSFWTFTLCGIGFVWYGVLFSELIPYIFGTKWNNSIYIFLSLCFVAMIRFLDLYIPVFLAATGRSKIGLLSEVLNTSCCIILVWIQSTSYGVWGAVATAFFYSIINIIIRFRTLPKSFYTVGLYFEKFRIFLTIASFSLLNVGLNFFYIDGVIYRLLISLLFLLLVIVFIDRLNGNIKKRLLDLFK